MATEEEIMLVLKAVVDDAVKNLNTASGSVDKLDSSTAKTGDTSVQTAAKMVTLNSAINVAKQGVAELTKLYNESIGALVTYSDRVDNFSRSLGVSAQEASSLIQVADDLNISESTLDTAMRQALKKGVDPSIEGIKKLAAEYQAIQDPIEKTKFVMENFGSRTYQMNKILEQSPEKIDSMVAAFQKEGLILSGETLASTRRYKLAVNELGDSLQSLGYAIAEELIPVLSDIVEPLAKGIASLTHAHTAMLNYRDGMIESSSSYDDYIARVKEAIDTESYHHDGLITLADGQQINISNLINMSEEEYNYQKAAADSADATDTARTATEQYSDALDTLSQAQKDLTAAQTTWKEGTANDVVSQLDSSKIKGKEYMDALAAIDDVMGTSEVAEKEHKDRVADIVKEYKKTGDIDQFKQSLKDMKENELPQTTTQLEIATAQAKALNDQITGLTKVGTISIDVNFTTSGPGSSLFNNTTP